MPEPHLVVGHALKAAEVLDRILLDQRVRLDFNGMERATVLDDQVDLAFLGVAVEPHVAQVRPGVHMALQHFGDDEGLEYVARDGAVAKLVRRVPTGEVADQPRIREIDLGRLGELFPGVRPEGVEDADDARSLKDRRPGLDGLVVNVDVVCDGARVEQLPRSRRHGHHEVVELALVLQVDKGAHVALEVGLDVA